MAVSNIKQVNDASNVIITWESTLTYSYVILDGALFERTTQNRSVAARGTFTDLQIFDSNSDSYDWQSALDPYSYRRLIITWDSLISQSSDVVGYRVYLNGSLAEGEIPEDGSSTYSYTTPPMADGEHTITVQGVDDAGNVSATSNFAFDIIGPPEPVSGIQLSQSGSPLALNVSWTASPSF